MELYCKDLYRYRAGHLKPLYAFQMKVPHSKFCHYPHISPSMRVSRRSPHAISVARMKVHWIHVLSLPEVVSTYNSSTRHRQAIARVSPGTMSDVVINAKVFFKRVATFFDAWENPTTDTAALNGLKTLAVLLGDANDETTAYTKTAAIQVSSFIARCNSPADVS